MFDRVPTLPPLPVDGTFPENYEVERDDSARIVRLKTRFYEVTHDLAKGGAISAIVLLRGTGQNMLTEPISCSVTTSDWKTTLSDVNAPATECEILREGKYATLVMISELRPATEEAPNPGVKIRTVYEYRWGYIRVKRQFLFPDTGFAVAQIMAHQWKLRPDISHFGVRNGTPACDPTHCGESKWGHLDPGRANDYPIGTAMRHVMSFLAILDGKELSGSCRRILHSGHTVSAAKPVTDGSASVPPFNRAKQLRCKSAH